MNTIDFKIEPSLESNDHQVRLVIDDKDFLGGDYLGLDPPSFFKQDNFLKKGLLMIGRCTCGCEGCADYPVNVTVDDDVIAWTSSNGLRLTFDKTDFGKKLLKVKNDHSWENDYRRTERLVSELIVGKKTTDNYSFDWVSTRVKDKVVTLSFSKNGYQRLHELPWDKTSIDNTLTNVKQFLNKQGIVVK